VIPRCYCGARQGQAHPASCPYPEYSQAADRRQGWQEARVRLCPQCGATLNRLSGVDGWIMVPVLGRGEGEQRRLLDVIYLCPKCEYSTAGAGIPGIPVQEEVHG